MFFFDCNNVLCDYDWPGNINELRNVIERAVILANGPILKVAVPTDVLATAMPPKSSLASLAEVERDPIVQVLEACGWRVRGLGGAAAIFGLNPSTLESRMNKLSFNGQLLYNGLFRGNHDISCAIAHCHRMDSLWFDYNNLLNRCFAGLVFSGLKMAHFLLIFSHDRTTPRVLIAAQQNPNPDRRIPSARVAPCCMAVEMKKPAVKFESNSH